MYVNNIFLKTKVSKANKLFKIQPEVIRLEIFRCYVQERATERERERERERDTQSDKRNTI